MKLTSIDPSINTSGFAYFENGVYRGAETLNIPKGEDLRMRLEVLGAATIRRMQLFQPGIVLLEKPGSWSRGGKNVGALQLLAMATGVIFQAVADQSVALIYFVPVEDWKQRRESEEIRRDMELLFNTKFPSEHCSDAAGMAHWWMSHQRIKQFNIFGKGG